MLIKQINHKFNGQLRKRQRTDAIIIHHSASHDASAVEIHNWHIQKGWAGIGYHFVIRKNGDIETGRPHDTIGVHAGAKINTHSVSICLSGNFMYTNPTEFQIDALRGLYGLLKGMYGSDISLMLHRQVSNTLCPGVNFDLDSVLNPSNNADWATEPLRWATDNKITDGTRPLDYVTRQEVITMLFRFNNLIKI